MKFQLRLRHDEIRLADALGIERERAEELKDTVRIAMLCHDRVSKVVELVSGQCQNINELIYASMMIGYIMGANRPVIIP